MKLPTYLSTLTLSTLQVDYDWDWEILISFRECTVEDNPRLAEALDLISTKAAFALGVACLEWVVARVEGNVDTSDTLQRIEAGWAAAIDARYASLPQPPRSTPSPPQEFVRPLHLARKILSDVRAAYTNTDLVDKVYSGAQGLLMLVDHIAGRHQAFDPWLADSLRRCHEHFPASEDPVEAQKPVPREFFEPSFLFSEDTMQDAIGRFMETLDPATNPYLRASEEMLIDGFEGQPYGRSI